MEIRQAANFSYFPPVSSLGLKAGTQVTRLSEWKAVLSAEPPWQPTCRHLPAHVPAHVPAHGSSFPTSSQTCVVNFFLMTAILTGVTQTFRTVLRCSSLGNEEVEWFLTYLGAICISSVKKDLRHSYPLYWSNGLGFLWCFVFCGYIYIYISGFNLLSNE